MSTHWAPGNADLPASGVTPGTYGDGTHVGQVTVDAAGRVTGAADVAITGGGGGGTIEVTDGTHTVAAATEVDFTSGATVTDAGGGVAQVAITGGGGGGGSELDYVEATGGDLSITGGSAASPTTAITGNAIPLDGATDILVEFYCYFAHVTGGGVLVADLWDGSTNIGRMGGCDIFGDGGATSNTLNCKFFLRGSRRPSNASHTYAVKLWKSGTASIGGGAGGNDVGVPYWYRVTTL